MTDKLINEYIQKSTITPVVTDLKETLFDFFEDLDRLQGMHKLLVNELETTYLMIANLTGLSGFHRALLGNYGVHYTKIGHLFAEHYAHCTDIVNIAMNKINLAQVLDQARLRLLQGLAVHRMKDIELTYHVTHDPTCRAHAMKLISLDLQFKKAVETRDRKFHLLHAMIFAMIRIQEEFMNTYNAAISSVVGSSTNVDFIGLIGERTKLLDKIVRKCIKYHSEINNDSLKEVYGAFERYRKYNNIDIGFKLEYISDGTFDGNFKTYIKLTNAIKTTIDSLKGELLETEVREKLGFDARQQKVLVATNPQIVELEGARSGLKHNLEIRKKENINVHTTLKDCIKHQGAELQQCILQLEGVKNNDAFQVAEYTKNVEKLKGMKGMLRKYYEINSILARKMVEISQINEKNSLEDMINSLVKERSVITDMERKLAEEKAKYGDVERSIRARAMETGYALPTVVPGQAASESAGNVLRKITNGTEASVATSQVQYPGKFINSETENQKTHHYVTASLQETYAPVHKISSEVALIPGLLPGKSSKGSNPLTYLAVGGSNLPSATWSNPITGYSYQMNVIDSGAYADILRNEFENYKKCQLNNKILISNELHKNLATIRGLPDSHPDKARLYNELIQIQQNIDNYSSLHACGTTYQRAVDGINGLGFDKIIKLDTPIPTTAPGTIPRPSSFEYGSDPHDKKHGRFTPCEVDQMVSTLDTFIECFNSILMNFDARCKTLEELCLKGKETLDALVLDLQAYPDDLDRVKKYINDVHKDDYNGKTYSYNLTKPAKPCSLKDYIYGDAKENVKASKKLQKDVINAINDELRRFEKLKMTYRNLVSMLNTPGNNKEIYKNEYHRLLEELYNATVYIEIPKNWPVQKPILNIGTTTHTNAPYTIINNRLGQPLAGKPIKQDSHSPQSFIAAYADKIAYSFRGYLSMSQAINQAVNIIYAYVDKYNGHYRKSMQDRITHYAIMSREYINNNLKFQIVQKEQKRLFDGFINNGYTFNHKGITLTNSTRYEILMQLIDHYNRLQHSDTQKMFDYFKKASRLNVINHSDIADIIQAIGGFQNCLNDYATEIAKETNVYAEFTAQMNSVFKTKCKLMLDSIFTDEQLSMIEVFNLPNGYGGTHAANRAAAAPKIVYSEPIDAARDVVAPYNYTFYGGEDEENSDIKTTIAAFNKLRNEYPALKNDKDLTTAYFDATGKYGDLENILSNKKYATKIEQTKTSILDDIKSKMGTDKTVDFNEYIKNEILKMYKVLMSEEIIDEPSGSGSVDTIKTRIATGKIAAYGTTSEEIDSDYELAHAHAHAYAPPSAVPPSLSHSVSYAPPMTPSAPSAARPLPGPIYIGGVYPNHPYDIKTNFDFIRFLCRRMLENDRWSKIYKNVEYSIQTGRAEYYKPLMHYRETNRSTTAISNYAANGYVIQGGNN